MATVYSLVCWGGRTGKNVTFTDTGDVVNSTKHGLRNGTALYFSSTGALPTGLSSVIPYYARQGADIDKFLLYPTKADAIAGTNQVTFSGTGSGTHTAKSALMLDYLAQYPGRWGDAGSERCYDGLLSWGSARQSAASILDAEVCELGQGFTEYTSSLLAVAFSCASVSISPTIDGEVTEAFHNGQVNTGFEFSSSYSSTVVNLGNAGLYSGFSITNTAAGGGINITHPGAHVDSLIIRNTSGAFGTSKSGVAPGVAGCKITNCLILGYKYGLSITAYKAGAVIANNTFTKNDIGVYTVSTNNVNGYFWNNISIGNTTLNWSSQPTGLHGAGANSGLSTDSPWVTSGFSSVVMTTGDFVDYSGGNFYPASLTSPQVDSGVAYYTPVETDITDAERPNYNNGGAEAFDIGCYEYDHGYGPHPATVNCTFSGVKAGSEIRVYLISTGEELVGIESCSADQTLSWQANTNVRIVIINTEYELLDFNYSAGEGNVSIPLTMNDDPWFNDPV